MQEHLIPIGTANAAGLSLEERPRCAQELVASHVEPGALLSEELLAQRRAAAMEE